MNWWSAAATFAGVAALGFVAEYAVNKRYWLVLPLPKRVNGPLM